MSQRAATRSSARLGARSAAAPAAAAASPDRAPAAAKDKKRRQEREKTTRKNDAADAHAPAAPPVVVSAAAPAAGTSQPGADQVAQLLARLTKAEEQRAASEALVKQLMDRLDARDASRSAIIDLSSAAAAPAAPATSAAAAGSTTVASSLSALPTAPRDTYKTTYAGAGGLDLDAWIRRARQNLSFYRGLAALDAVVWLATGLEGAAADWFAEVSNTDAAPKSPDELFAGMRARFQPVNSAEVARRDLDSLTQGKLSVNDYVTRFRQLIAHLPKVDEDTRMHMFRKGLRAAIEDKIDAMDPQPSTLEKVIAVAARLEGRAQASGRGASEGVANIEPGQQLVTLDQISAIVDQAVSRATAAAAPGGARPGYDSRRDRGANKRSESTPMWKRVGLTPEEGQRRMATGLCLWCSKTGHIMRDCSDRAAGKPAKLN